MKGLKHPATAVAATCAALIAGGASFGAAGGLAGHGASGQRLYACVQGAGGEPGELSLSTASATCPNGSQKISWNVQGRRGLRGKTGGRGAAGSSGATGSQGQPGAKGDTGATGQPGPKGDQGTPGTPGQDGTSVTSAALSLGDANCPTGGSSFTAVSGTTYACNGAQGPKGDMGPPEL
jgi:hypothetical protein